MSLFNKNSNALRREQEFQNRIRNHYQIKNNYQYEFANQLLRNQYAHKNPFLQIQCQSPPLLEAPVVNQQTIHIIPPARHIDSQIENENIAVEKELNDNAVVTEEHMSLSVVESKPKIFNSIIPLNIFQTWHSLDLPPKMKENVDRLKRDNPEFKHYLYDDAMCREFIVNNFQENVVYAFDKLKPGAYKSDLWRYCILYVYGGIYIDIKYQCVNGFKFMELTDKDHYVKDRNYSISDNIPGCHGVYQAIICCLPQRKILHECIQKIIKNCVNNKYNYNDLDITGPHTFGSLFNHNVEICKLNICFTGESIMIDNRTILEYYDDYRIEQSMFQKTDYYKKMWLEKNIYHYPRLKEKKTFDISSTRTFSVLEKDVELYSGTPSIVEYKGGYLINIRWINYNYNEDGSKKRIPLQWLSVNTRYIMNSDFEKISSEQFLQDDFQKQQFYDGMGLEDIRMINYNDNYYYIATYFDCSRRITSTSSSPFTYQEESYALDHNIISPQFYDLDEIKIIEKNWSPFVYQEDLCVVYKWFPLQIGKIDYESNKLNRIEIKYNTPDYFEDARGTTPGYTRNGEIWFVLHKAQTYQESDKNYYNYQHFFAVFDMNMNLLRYSELFKFGDCKVEFCIGLIVKESEIILSYSLLDTQSMISIYEMNDVNNGIKWYV
jgi:hypothetical protein